MIARALLAAAVAASLLACGGSTDAGDSGMPEAGPDWPLTGLAPADHPVEGPVLTVKVDNTAQALPQSGLGAADIVVEEPVEGGLTRLAVLLHSSVPSAAELVTGPVRSVRSSDIGIVKPADAVLLASGGADEVVDDLDEAGVETRFEGTPGFERDESRSAPYDLYVDVVEAAAALDAPGPSQPYFEFGEPDAQLAGEPAGSVVLEFSPEHSTRLVASGDTWSRELGEPDGFTATTVLALLVEQDTADYLDPGGFPVPINITEGQGDGWLVHDGQVVPIRWSKPSAADTWSFETVSGEEVLVAPGRTYVGLLPVTTGSLRVDS